jgi:ketosteroid isomerase-like protein
MVAIKPTFERMQPAVLSKYFQLSERTVESRRLTARGSSESLAALVRTTKQKAKQEPMKTPIKSLLPHSLIGKLGTYLAATVTVGLLALGTNGLLMPARADSDCDHRALQELREMLQKSQLAELHQVEEDFHLAGSYGGDIDLEMSLWANDATLTIASTGAVISGKDAIRTFWTGAGPFTHYWVGLTPAFKLTADIHGDTAELSFQCVYVDPAVTPAVVAADAILTGTVKKVHGKWLLWHMTSLPATLQP